MARTMVSGAVALVVGVLVYLAGRDAVYSQWIPAVPAIAGTLSFGSAGDWLPSLAHVVGFSLLSAALLPLSARTTACVAWCSVDVAFEVGQHAQITPMLSAWLTQSWVAKPAADALDLYFTRGTFDTRDLLACLAGAVLAVAILQLDRPRCRGVGDAV